MIDELLWVQRKMNHLATYYLDRQGHFGGQVARADGSPTPWFTYPAISFLDDILQRRMRVLEYGSGNSSRYFNEHCDEVYSVEHDPKWAQKLQDAHPEIALELVTQGAPVLPAAEPLLESFRNFGFATMQAGNVAHETMHGLLNLEFAGYASRVFRQPKGHYDLIVVDGMARGLSMFFAAAMVSDDGFIVLDNSDRWQYNEFQQYLIDRGFGRVDFWGPGPLNDCAWCTSFFSKNFRIQNTRPVRKQRSGDLGW